MYKGNRTSSKFIDNGNGFRTKRNGVAGIRIKSLKAFFKHLYFPFNPSHCSSFLIFNGE
jgi:hypothetical protein